VGLRVRRTWRFRTCTTGDGKGIDHLEASAILPAVFAAAEACGIELSEE
jgi:hypothetical protein